MPKKSFKRTQPIRGGRKNKRKKYVHTCMPKNSLRGLSKHVLLHGFRFKNLRGETKNKREKIIYMLEKNRVLSTTKNVELMDYCNETEILTQYIRL
jgi:hypothetical protein